MHSFTFSYQLSNYQLYNNTTKVKQQNLTFRHIYASCDKCESETGRYFNFVKQK